jgi:predicted NodU family carbamoyl transferase
MYEEAFFHLIGRLQARSGLTDIALAAGDAGGAIGAAFAVWHRLGGK